MSVQIDDLVGELIERYIATGDGNIYRQALADFDKSFITQVNKRCGRNHTLGASVCGMSRTTYRNKMKVIGELI